MSPISLPYLQIYTSRGRQFVYYRRNGRQVRIQWPLGEPGFGAAYEAAQQAWQAAQEAPHQNLAARPGSLLELIIAYRAAPEFRTLATKTQTDYNRVLAELERRFGHMPAAEAPRAWVIRLRDEKQDTPRTANYRVAIIRALFSFALARDLVPANPALGVKLLRTGAGYRAWSDAEIAAMTSPEAGEIALPVMIALHTAMRQGDVLRLLWSAYDGGYIHLRQGKLGAAAEEMAIKASPELIAALDAKRRALDASGRRAAVICLTDAGRPWKSDYFRRRFAEVRAALGMPADLHFHGLRHTAGKRLAESGASDAEIQAVTGHRTRQMVEKYTRQARQKGLSRAAVVRLGKQHKGNKSGVPSV